MSNPGSKSGRFRNIPKSSFRVFSSIRQNISAGMCKYRAFWQGRETDPTCPRLASVGPVVPRASHSSRDRCPAPKNRSTKPDEHGGASRHLLLIPSPFSFVTRRPPCVVHHLSLHHRIFLVPSTLPIRHPIHLHSPPADSSLAAQPASLLHRVHRTSPSQTSSVAPIAHAVPHHPSVCSVFSGSKPVLELSLCEKT